MEEMVLNDFDFDCKHGQTDAQNGPREINDEYELHQLRELNGQPISTLETKNCCFIR